MKKKVLFVQLNEINFDVVNEYINQGYDLNFFKKIKDQIKTSYSETEYQNLEPWIQWFSIYSGKEYKYHKIFRLGDGVKYNEELVLEKIESLGYSIGAICPMNYPNNLKNPKYFLPDPWTNTNTDGSKFSKKIYTALKQLILDNAKSKIQVSSLFHIFIAFVTKVSFKGKFKLIKFAIKAVKSSWYKVLFLDYFLFELNNHLSKKFKPNLSLLFLNGGAHFQHHYFFNSKVINSKYKNPDWYVKSSEDPLYEILKLYDSILIQLSKNKDLDIIFATGLSQSQYDNIKFYYKLKNHNSFLNELGIEFRSIQELMTRDFIIFFKEQSHKESAHKILSSLKMNNINLFKDIEIREDSIFLSFAYPDEITENCYIFLNEKKIYVKNHVTFIAIKNGMHNQKGYFYFSDNINNFSPKNEDNVKYLHNSLFSIFI